MVCYTGAIDNNTLRDLCQQTCSIELSTHENFPVDIFVPQYSHIADSPILSAGAPQLGHVCIEILLFFTSVPLTNVNNSLNGCALVLPATILPFLFII